VTERRFQTAVAAMQGILASGSWTESVAQDALACADSLIAQYNMTIRNPSHARCSRYEYYETEYPDGKYICGTCDFDSRGRE
jgi:hypothetical protein